MRSIREEILSWPANTAATDKKRILAQEKPSGVTVDRDHWYMEDRSEWHSFEVVRPMGGATKTGTVIEIHGGAWIYGNKELNENHTMYLSSMGYNAVSLSYDLVRSVTLMETMKCIMTFLTFIEDSREALELDLSSVLITGDSAGAHLAALTYALLKDSEMRKAYGIGRIPSFEVTALGLSHPVMCLEPLGSMGDTPESDRLISEEMLRMMTGLDDYTESPIYGFMSFDDFCRRIKWPPIYIVTSMMDGWHPNTLRSLKALDDADVPYTMKCWGRKEGLGHVFHILFWHYPESREANDSMLRFFEEHKQENQRQEI